MRHIKVKAMIYIKQRRKKEKTIVRNGIQTHAHINGPDLKSGTLDRFATLTVTKCSTKLCYKSGYTAKSHRWKNSNIQKSHSTNKKGKVRNGIRTHAHFSGPDLESGALDRSATLTVDKCPTKLCYKSGHTLVDCQSHCWKNKMCSAERRKFFCQEWNSNPCPHQWTRS